MKCAGWLEICSGRTLPHPGVWAFLVNISHLPETTGVRLKLAIPEMVLCVVLRNGELGKPPPPPSSLLHLIATFCRTYVQKHK